MHAHVCMCACVHEGRQQRFTLALSSREMTSPNCATSRWMVNLRRRGWPHEVSFVALRGTRSLTVQRANPQGAQVQGK